MVFIDDILAAREQRTTVSRFGIDIIITPKGELKIVEINGANSGGVGLRNLTGRDVGIEMLQYIAVMHDLPLYRWGRLENSVYPSFVQPADQEKMKLARQVRLVAPPKCTQFVLPAYPPEKDSFKAVIWNHFPECIFDEQEFLVLNPFAVEDAAHRKDIAHQLLQGLGVRPRMAYLRKDNEAIPLTEPFSSEYVVIKPVDEYQGRLIKVLPSETFDLGTALPGKSYHELLFWAFQQKGISFSHEPTIIVEELIPSKKIFSQVTEQKHFGCMRYLILVESQRGKIRVNHYGGYWRLAPQPCTNTEVLQTKFVANYCNGAIPERVSRDDLSFVKKRVDEFFPVFYRRLLRLPINERPDDGMRLEDYCY